MAINPKGADLKKLLAEDDGKAFVMLNLLRFVPQGLSKYQEYVNAFRGFAQKYGAEVIYVGSGSTILVAEKGQAWDAVMLVRYPNRLAFSRMVADPDYQKVTHLRTNSLEEAVLQATTPWSE